MLNVKSEILRLEKSGHELITQKFYNFWIEQRISDSDIYLISGSSNDNGWLKMFMLEWNRLRWM
jgi:hypothetical protein